MGSEDYSRLETKIDRILDITSGISANQAAHAARLDSVEKETDQQNDRINDQDGRIRKTETSLSWIRGGVALLGGLGVMGFGGIATWLKSLGGGNGG